MRPGIAIPILLFVLGLAPLAQAGPPQPVDPPFITSSQEVGGRPAGDLDPNTVVTAMVQLGDMPATNTTAALSSRARIDAAQRKLVPQLEQRGAQVLFRTQLAYNGIAVRASVRELSALREVPGVAGVQIVTPKSQIEARIPGLISSSLTQAAPEGSDGAGVRIGVIDSGIDYTHADFGGLGSAAAYDANDRTTVEPGSFPTAKVSGGYDFAGDNYDASGSVGAPTPAADADPLDCSGRGTHIAGLIAGSGVTGAGATFGGPYAPTNDYASFRVPPGVAPNASLYALKVFGCDPTSTTTLTIQAIEWALDPNHDGDPSDHLDAVLIALSTPFGGSDDPDAVAVGQAVRLGMTVVSAAGDGDGSFFSVNSFGAASEAIAVGASVGSPQPLNSASESYVDPACYKNGDLAAWYVAQDAAQFSNRSNNCTLQVGIASYRKFDEVIDHQQIFDWREATLEPGQSIRLEVKLPDCATQVDIFRGPAIYSLDGRRYAARLFEARHLDGNRYCPPSTAPVFGLPNTTARGIQRGDGLLKPDLVAPSVNIRSAGFATGFDGASQSASWVGAAQVVGAVALERQLHPGWSPAQIKAALMNTAATVLMDDLTPYPPSLAGAGQLDLSRLPTQQILAHSAENSAALSYGAPRVAGLWSSQQSLRIENTGDTARQFSLSTVATAASEPGVTLSIPTATLGVPAHGSIDVPVVVTVDPAALDFSADAATEKTVKSGEIERPRYFLAEHSGYIKLESAGTQPLTVPFILMPQSAAQAKASGPVALPGTATTFTLPLQNSGARSSTTLTSSPNSQAAAVSAFELIGTSGERGNLPQTLRGADLRYLGVTSNLATSAADLPGVLFVGLASHGAWSTPNEVQFRILFDTNLDGVADYALVNSSLRDANGRETDSFRFGLYTVQSDGQLGNYLGESLWNTLSPITAAPYVDVAPFSSSGAFAALGVRSLNLPAGQTVLNMRVETRARQAAGFTSVVDQLPDSGWIRYDLAKPAVLPLANRGVFNGRPLFLDATNETISGAVYPANIVARGAKLLLLHHHNTQATQAEVVDVRIATPVPAAAQPGSYRVYIPAISNR